MMGEACTLVLFISSANAFPTVPCFSVTVVALGWKRATWLHYRPLCSYVPKFNLILTTVTEIKMWMNTVNLEIFVLQNFQNFKWSKFRSKGWDMKLCRVFFFLNTRQKEASTKQDATLVIDSAIQTPQLDRLEPCWSMTQVYWPRFLPFSLVVTTTSDSKSDRLWGQTRRQWPLRIRQTILWLRIDIVSSSSTRT